MSHRLALIFTGDLNQWQSVSIRTVKNLDLIKLIGRVLRNFVIIWPLKNGVKNFWLISVKNHFLFERSEFKMI
ncbi:MAG: hypothetical protein DWQ05_22670 [Calditrichaeota bacterium]|nr:MAG: hypothetical protein DWQ05_22670 [Calditrichota bacterium]